MQKSYDAVIVGGGIIGLATAMKYLERKPGKRVAVLEKERVIAKHQTGTNSGVIHSGIYYKPGSLKAKTCLSGREQLLKFCDENNVRYELCGKVIVATDSEELPRLEALYERGVANGVPGLELIGKERLNELEPNVNGIKAVYCPSTGIVDYIEVAKAYAQKITALGGEVITKCLVKNIKNNSSNSVIVQTSEGEFTAGLVINCAGLYSDRVAGETKNMQIVPFRGEYYELKEEKRHLVKNLIYPVPDPRFPFLGVHFTRGIHGNVEAGPNAVLAFSREGYTKSKINLYDLFQTLTFKGFIKILVKYWRVGIKEWHRSLSKSEFTRSLQRLIPAVTEGDLLPAQAGVRAQAVSSNGDLLDDFFIKHDRQVTHVLNAPSPGATASLAIADEILNAVLSRRF